MGMPSHRGIYLVLLGAALGALALAIPVAAQEPEALSSPDPVTPPARTAPSSPGNAAAGFRAVAGPACPVDASRWTTLSAGWEVVPGDSWTGDGCGDRFLYSASDSSNYVQWQFTFGTTAARTCRVEVFVPDSPLAQALVRYAVADRGFTVDQKANRGRWVRAVSVPVATAALAVRLDTNQSLTGLAAGPVRVTCT